MTARTRSLSALACALVVASCTSQHARAEGAPGSMAAGPGSVGGASVSPALATRPSGGFDERYRAGVAAYEAGRHEEAAQIFRTLVVEGHVHPGLLLALGDADYRLGHMVEAVWAYEWAAALAPGDQDVRENLRLTREHLITDRVGTEASPAFEQVRRALRAVPGRFTLGAALLLWTLGWLLLALRLAGRLDGWTWLGVALLLVALPLASHAAWQASAWWGPPRGIVQELQIEVRSGPGPEYAALFTLHLGTVIEQVEQRAAWARIQVPNGPTGWIPTADIALLGHPETVRPGI